jgi:hypothetical protein
MLKFFDKRWKRWIFIFLITFIVGFVIGYLIMTWQFYSGKWDGVKRTNFWQVLSPL